MQSRARNLPSPPRGGVLKCRLGGSTAEHHCGRVAREHNPSHLIFDQVLTMCVEIHCMILTCVLGVPAPCDVLTVHAIITLCYKL